MTSIDPKLKLQLTKLFNLSPIVWAVVKGANTPELIADRLDKPLYKVQLGIAAGVSAKLLKRRGDEVLPTNPHHLYLVRQLNPQLPPVRGQLYPQLPDTPFTTRRASELSGRPYNSVYRSLRKLHDLGRVGRQGRLWHKI